MVLLCVVIIGCLFARTIWEQPQLPLPHWQILAVLSILNSLLAVVAFLVKPGGGVMVTNMPNTFMENYQNVRVIDPQG